MYQTIFFDLDGTLTDSGPGITHSVAYALNKWNIKVEDYSVLNAFGRSAAGGILCEIL